MTKNNTLTASFAKVAAITLLTLFIPFSALFITDEMAWSLYDFILAGVMLFGSGSIFVLISRKSESVLFKSALGLMLASALFLLAANIAVGIIGSEDNTINLFYFLVVVLLVVGSFIARFKPRGMAITLFTTALAQAAMIPVALNSGIQNSPESSVTEIIMINGLFITLFMISGALFWQDDKNRQ